MHEMSVVHARCARHRSRMHDPLDDRSFDAKLTIAVTREMRDAVARAATAQRRSISDFARGAIADELTLLRVPMASPTPRGRR
jgi:hypothetical protein